MAYIGAGITRFNTADELTVTGTSEFGGNVSFGDNNITNVGSLQIDSIAGDADTNTNITFAGSDVITMTTAGSERLRLDASGNLLVGTTDPLVGSGTGNNTEGLALSAGSYGGYATFSRSGSECLNLNRKTNDGTILNFRKDGSTVGVVSVYGADMFIGTDDAGLTFNNAADLIAPVNPTTGATRDGAIDLGASNARFKDGYFSGILYNTSLRGQNDTDTGIDVGDTTGSLSNTLTFLTAGSERMRIDTSGNVGIGNSTPGNFYTGANQLVVGDGSGDNGISLYGGTSGVNRIYFADGSSGAARYDGYIEYSHSNRRMLFGTAANTRMTIDSNGNLGIGTTSPNAPAAIVARTTSYEGLELVTPTGDGSGEFHIGVHQNGSTAGRSIVFKRGGTDGMDTESARIDSSGNLLVGTTGHFNFSGDTTEITVGSAGTGTNHGGAVTFVSNNGGTTLGYVGFQENLGQIATMGSRPLTLGTNNTERMRIDSSGNLLVGKTATGIGTVGAELKPTGELLATVNNDACAFLNRKSSDGAIINLRKDNTTAGSIGIAGGDLYISGGSSHAGIRFDTNILTPAVNGTQTDATVDLGYSSQRFKDLYLSGGVVFGATGGAVTSKTLDDYEEGTWTPAYSGTGGATTHTYTQQIGRYVKIGDLVHAYFALQTSASSGGSGSAIVTGLPFTVSTALYASGSVGFATAFTADDGPTGILGKFGDTTMFLYKRLSNSNQTNLSVNDFATGNANELYASVTYRT